MAVKLTKTKGVARKTVKIRRNLGLADCPACDGIGKTRIRRVLEDGRVIGPKKVEQDGRIVSPGQAPEAWICEECNGTGKTYKFEIIEGKPGQSVTLDKGRVYIIDHNGSLRRADKLSNAQMSAIALAIEDEKT